MRTLVNYTPSLVHVALISNFYTVTSHPLFTTVHLSLTCIMYLCYLHLLFTCHFHRPFSEPLSCLVHRNQFDFDTSSCNLTCATTRIHYSEWVLQHFLGKTRWEPPPDSSTSCPPRFSASSYYTSETKFQRDFETPIFTLIVGPEGATKTYTAHQAYLAGSPVFGSMCQAGSFQEGQTFQIRLPEDEPRAITDILRYLYSGYLQSPAKEYRVSNDGVDGMTDETERLAELYVATDKYDLWSLKKQVINQMRETVNIEDRPVDFLYMAKAVYASLPDCEDPFRGFVRAAVSGYEGLSDKTAKAREVFDGCIVDGGLLALDLFEARCN